MAERLGLLWQALISAYIIPLFVGGWLVADQVLYPFESYFDTGELRVETPHSSGDESISFIGGPQRSFLGSYKVVGRDAHTGNIACEGKDSGPRIYPPGPNYPPRVTMEWWEGPGGQCSALPPGAYYLETCWTVLDRGGLLGPATSCVRSNNFIIED